MSSVIGPGTLTVSTPASDRDDITKLARLNRPRRCSKRCRLYPDISSRHSVCSSLRCKLHLERELH